MKKREEWRISRMKRKAKRRDYLEKSVDIVNELGTVTSRFASDGSSSFTEGPLELRLDEYARGYSSYKATVAISYVGTEVFAGVYQPGRYSRSERRTINAFLEGDWEDRVDTLYKQALAVKNAGSEKEKSLLRKKREEQDDVIRSRFGTYQAPAIESPIKEQ